MASRIFTLVFLWFSYHLVKKRSTRRKEEDINFYNILASEQNKKYFINKILNNNNFSYFIPDTYETKMYKTKNDIIAQWATDALEESDELTSFDELYMAYEYWCDDEGYSSKQRPNKREVKEELKKMQDKTTYGLVLGKKMSDGCPNGTKNKPKFNFTVIDE